MSGWWFVLGGYLLIGLAVAAVLYELVTGGMDERMARDDMPADARREHSFLRTAFEASKQRAVPALALLLLTVVLAWPGMLGWAFLTARREGR